jgi:hypothetical protein
VRDLTLREAIIHLARFIAAVILSWVLLMTEMIVTVATKWTWLGLLFMTPGYAIQDALVRLGVVTAPRTGGHMPDFLPPIVFNLIVNFVVIFTLLNIYPTFLKSFFPKRDQA